MSKVEPQTIPERMKDNERLLGEMDKAVHDALRIRKLLGYSIAIWQDGKVAIIPPDQIPLSNGNGTADQH